MPHLKINLKHNANVFKKTIYTSKSIGVDFEPCPNVNLEQLLDNNIEGTLNELSFKSV